MRIIAGEWRGRRFEAPPTMDVRPTADRVRESWMSMLQMEIPGARVLDLFSGTGALGLSQEVGIITIADLIAKIGFGFYLLANVDAPEAESAPLNQSSQQYV